MSKELTNLGITLNENGFITSVDLVDIINYFRAIEKTKAVLQHKDFMKKIKHELKVLESLDLGERNFSLGSYTDKQNQKRPCYLLNKDGMLMMLNSESTIVRYKTVEYINELEEQLKNAKEDKEQLYNVAVSDKELEQRQYEADKVKYALRNVKSLLLDCDYTNLESTVNKILEVQTGLDKKDRYEYYRNMNDTEYKQYVRNYVKNKLNDVMISKPDIMLTIVAKTIQLQLESEAHTTTKRSTSHIISAKDNKSEI